MSIIKREREAPFGTPPALQIYNFFDIKFNLKEKNHENFTFSRKKQMV